MRITMRTFSQNIEVWLWYSVIDIVSSFSAYLFREARHDLAREDLHLLHHVINGIQIDHARAGIDDRAELLRAFFRRSPDRDFLGEIRRAVIGAEPLRQPLRGALAVAVDADINPLADAELFRVFAGFGERRRENFRLLLERVRRRRSGAHEAARAAR